MLADHRVKTVVRKNWWKITCSFNIGALVWMMQTPTSDTHENCMCVKTMWGLARRVRYYSVVLGHTRSYTARHTQCGMDTLGPEVWYGSRWAQQCGNVSHMGMTYLRGDGGNRLISVHGRGGERVSSIMTRERPTTKRLCYPAKWDKDLKRDTIAAYFRAGVGESLPGKWGGREVGRKRGGECNFTV